MNFKRLIAVLVVFFMGIELFSFQDQDEPKHSVMIYLYARPEREGSRDHVSVQVGGQSWLFPSFRQD